MTLKELIKGLNTKEKHTVDFKTNCDVDGCHNDASTFFYDFYLPTRKYYCEECKNEAIALANSKSHLKELCKP